MTGDTSRGVRTRAGRRSVVGRPARDPDGLGGQQGEHQRAGRRHAQVAQHGVVIDLDFERAFERWQRASRLSPDELRTALRPDLTDEPMAKMLILAAALAIDTIYKEENRGGVGIGDLMGE